MQLAVAAGGGAWLVMNAAMSAWNTYFPLMQRERYAGLASLLLPVVQALLQVCRTDRLHPNGTCHCKTLDVASGQFNLAGKFGHVS
jgi:hypothetical protein